MMKPTTAELIKFQRMIASHELNLEVRLKKHEVADRLEAAAATIKKIRDLRCETLEKWYDELQSILDKK